MITFRYNGGHVKIVIFDNPLKEWSRPSVSNVRSNGTAGGMFSKFRTLPCAVFGHVTNLAAPLRRYNVQFGNIDVVRLLL